MQTRLSGPMALTGVGPNAPIETNAAGGKQSREIARLDLLPPLAILQVGKVLQMGAERYAVDNWRKISWRSHLNKMLIHAMAILAADEQDDHMGHVACRALMALELWLIEKQKGG